MTLPPFHPEPAIAASPAVSMSLTGVLAAAALAPAAGFKLHRPLVDYLSRPRVPVRETSLSASFRAQESKSLGFPRAFSTI